MKVLVIVLGAIFGIEKYFWGYFPWVGFNLGWLLGGRPKGPQGLAVLLMFLLLCSVFGN